MVGYFHRYLKNFENLLTQKEKKMQTGKFQELKTHLSNFNIRFDSKDIIKFLLNLLLITYKYVHVMYLSSGQVLGHFRTS